MDEQTLYGDPENDPITQPNPSNVIDTSEEVSLSQIYANAVLITEQPVTPGDSFEINTEEASGPVSNSSDFAQQTLDIVKTDNTTEQKIFLTKSVVT